jgi:hypothetical protein
MDLSVLKGKVDRLVNEMFDEVGIFSSIGRDSDGDLFLEYSGVKFYFEVGEIETFEIGNKSWQFLEMPKLSLKIFAGVYGGLKPGAVLNKFAMEQHGRQAFSSMWTTPSTRDGRVDLWQGVTLAADALDVSELRNGLFQVIAALFETRRMMPIKVWD